MVDIHLHGAVRLLGNQVRNSLVERERHSERPRHVEYVLGDVGEDEVGRDRRDLIEAGFTEFAFDIVFAREAETAMELQASIGRFPRRLGGKVLRHVGLSGTIFAGIEAATSLVSH